MENLSDSEKRSIAIDYFLELQAKKPNDHYFIVQNFYKLKIKEEQQLKLVKLIHSSDVETKINYASVISSNEAAEILLNNTLSLELYAKLLYNSKISSDVKKKILSKKKVINRIMSNTHTHDKFYQLFQIEKLKKHCGAELLEDIEDLMVVKNIIK